MEKFLQLVNPFTSLPERTHVTSPRLATPSARRPAAETIDIHNTASFQPPSLWGTLKTELAHHQRFATREQTRQTITEYIEIFYNRMRKQARLGYLSPAAFKQKYYANKIAA